MPRLSYIFLLLALSAAQARVERVATDGGGELLTFFEKETPVVSILRDTLGDSDPHNDKLRQIWEFRYTRPSKSKQIAATIPFLYFRTFSSRGSAKDLPPNVLDVAHPAHGTTGKILGRAAQSMLGNPLAIPSARAYRARSEEYRLMHLWRTLDVLDHQSAEESGLSDEELQHIKGRILLSRQMLGGLVSDEYVPQAWANYLRASSEMRSRNWEILRQQAEENGLLFQPIHTGSPHPSFALIWVEVPDAQAAPRRFDARFLGISDPFKDERLQNWKGYSETWWLDGRPTRVIPLAVYALEFPRVPLLLVDFRNTGRPKRREMVKRVSDDVTTGVLSFTGMGRLYFMAAKQTWFFVRGRHGGALDRSARIRAHVQLRHALEQDHQLAASLRNEISTNLERLGLNPLANGTGTEQKIAERQHQALVNASASGLIAKDLLKNRGLEARSIVHTGSERTLLRMASIATFGIYQHREPGTAELFAQVERRRRLQWYTRYLEGLLEAGSDPEVVADMAEVRRSVEELTALAESSDKARIEAASLISRLIGSINDQQIRAECVKCLLRLASGRREIKLESGTD